MSIYLLLPVVVQRRYECSTGTLARILIDDAVYSPLGCMLAVQVHVAWANAKNCSSFYGAYLGWTGAGMSGATTKRFDESSRA